MSTTVTDNITNTINPRQETFKKISIEVIEFDFKTFDPRIPAHKQNLMAHLKYINGQLGKLLKGYE
jgi:hypothetical protein